MKLTKIVAVCALACAAMAGTAQATVSDDLNTANTTGRVIYISGASAVQKGFTAIISDMFETADLAYFADSKKDVGGTNYVGVVGTLKADAGTWGGEKAIVIYRVTGGSVWGVDPVARNQSINALKVTSADCTLSGAGAGTGTTLLPYVCTVGTNNRTPDAGVSDVAPKFFKQPYNTEGETAAAELSEDELAELESIPLYGLAFGVPVTKSVSATAVLDRASISGIMSGSITSWSKIQGETAGSMIICRRTPGSGTQAVMNMWAGNFPCTSSFNVPANRTSGATNYNAATKTYNIPAQVAGTDKLYVIENAASGDVRTCLDKAVTGGSYATKDRSGADVTVTFAGTNNKAVGVLSMDSLKNSVTVANANGNANWQFRPIDGAGTYTWDNTANEPVATGTGKFPTLATYESGGWDLQGWVSFNIPARTTTDATEKREVLDFFVAKAQDASKLAAITDLKKVAAGIPGNGYAGAQVLDAKYVGGDQCAPYNRLTND